MTRTNGISALEFELEEDSEFEVGDDETDDELDHSETDDSEEDMELEEDSELDDAELDEPDAAGFAERFYELSLRDSESELEIAREVDAIVREMEHEYFFKGLKKLVSKAGSSLIKTAGNYVKNATPLGGVMKMATSLASGNLSGLVGSLAKTALATVMQHPAFAAAMPALKALGFGTTGGEAPWSKLVDVAKDAYGQLAQTVDKEALTPAGASRLAHKAFNSALVRNSRRGTVGGASTGGRRKVVTLSRGDRLIVRVR